MTTKDYSAADKFHEATRELGMRIRHYPGMIESGKLTQALADKRIGIMRAIAEDYEREAEASEPRFV
jgi:hypothetical protein